MIDPILSLAFSVYSNKGAYALLLGSGASRAAEIPTGWEVVLDLIRKLAKLEGEDCEPAPDAWFRKKYQAEPDYSKLLDALCKTPAERQQLLRSYFEPNEEDLSEGRKAPTTAHKVIAQLVAAGYVRVIVTTNFDRLIERALEQVGVAPSVISTPDAAKGALPLAHSKATVVKLHGDYLDVRIKNTPAELGEYETEINKLLDQIFDEYGLIITGWSGDWDTALRAAIQRCPSRRFTTYWTTLSTPSDQAKRLVDFRSAQVVQMNDSGEFFEALYERIQALEEFTVSHPMSAKIASVTVKRHLTDPPPYIRLHDLIGAETERVYAELNEKNFPLSAFEPTEAEKLNYQNLILSLDFWHRRFHEEITNRARKYEALLDVLLSAVMTGVRWGGPCHAATWSRSIERLGNLSAHKSLWSRYGVIFPPVIPELNPMANLWWFQYGWIGDGEFFGAVPVAMRLDAEISLYPALLLMWGAGLAATAANDMQSLAAILRGPRLFAGSERCSLLASLPYQSVSRDDSGQKPAYDGDFAVPVDSAMVRHLDPSLLERVHKPLRFHLYDFFRPRMLDWLPNDSAYDECFDRWEHFVAVLRYHLFSRSGSPFPWGCHWYWSGFRRGNSRTSNEITDQLGRGADGKISPLRATLFDDVHEEEPGIYACDQAFRGEPPERYIQVPAW